jgi:protein SCO1/2
LQPFSWPAAALFIATGGALTFYFRSEKQKMEAKKSMRGLISKTSLRLAAEQEAANQKVGRPKIGGPFSLLDQDGKPYTDRDLLGSFSLVYVRAWPAYLSLTDDWPVWVYQLPGYLPGGAR